MCGEDGDLEDASPLAPFVIGASVYDYEFGELKGAEAGGQCNKNDPKKDDKEKAPGKNKIPSKIPPRPRGRTGGWNRGAPPLIGGTVVYPTAFELELYSMMAPPSGSASAGMKERGGASGSCKGSEPSGGAGTSGDSNNCAAWINKDSEAREGSLGHYNRRLHNTQPTEAPSFESCFDFMGTDEGGLDVYRMKSDSLLYYR